MTRPRWRLATFALAALAIAAVSTPVAAQTQAPAPTQPAVAPVTSFKDLVLRTVQACRDEQEGKQLLFAAAHQLGYEGSFTFGFFRAIEGQSVKLDIQKQGCRLTFIASPKPFIETHAALLAQLKTWNRPQTVYDSRKPLKQADGDSLRTFAGWQSDDKIRSELLIIDEPDPASKASRAGYVIAYGWFTQ